ncbi:hypothetical protein [Kangiella sp. M94]
MIKYLMILIFAFLVSCKNVRAEEDIKIYVNSWVFEPMNDYSINDIKSNPTFMIESFDFAFIEELKGELKLASLQKGKLNKVKNIRVVIDISDNEKVTSYVSDGEFICEVKQESCLRLDVDLKEVLDPLSILKEI